MRSRSVLAALLVAVLLTASGPIAAFDELIDSPMYRLPALPTVKVERVLPKDAVSLWIEALKRPETDYRIKAAEALALAAQRGFKEATPAIETLQLALAKETHAAARLALVQALVALDAKEAAQLLWDAAQTGNQQMRALVEPALARWKYPKAAAAWLQRLDTNTPQPALVLALRGLGHMEQRDAADRIRDLLLDEATPPRVLWEAGQALGQIRTAGLETLALQLLKTPGRASLSDRLAAAALLRQHKGAEAMKVLNQLARDEAAAVVHMALTRIVELDLDAVAGMAPRLLADPDANLRLLAVDVLAQRPSKENLRSLSSSLDDPHLEVRRRARVLLEKLAVQKELRFTIIDQATTQLQAASWRGLEQATLLLVQLDHKPAAPRLLELLAHSRPEVDISAAWGLRKLAVPGTAPAVLQHVRQVRPTLNPMMPFDQLMAAEHRLAQLNQFLGQQRYRAAEEELKKFVPKMSIAAEARAAAVWALGMIHEGEALPKLARQLEGRLNDTSSIPPEDPRVRYMSAITLARINAKEALPSLRIYCPDQEVSDYSVNTACGWAIEKLSGEPLKAPRTLRIVHNDWFLLPRP